MRYVRARLNISQRNLTYRIYVTDALRLFGGLNLRWYDMVENNDTPKVEITAQEAVTSIKNKFLD